MTDATVIASPSKRDAERSAAAEESSAAIAGLSRGASPVAPVRNLAMDWDFHPSIGPWSIEGRRAIKRWLTRRPPPAWSLLKAPELQHRAWVLYFVFAPDGVLTDSHRYTLQRLQESGWGLLVVCAAPMAERVPVELREADALCWKALSGYDFSAYAIGLHLLAERAPGSTVFVLNDSVFGPLVDLGPFFEAARWDLTGFTASSANGNHLQSYAFIMKDVTPSRLATVHRILPTDHAFDTADDAIICQELCLARHAARFMSVGAFVHADQSTVVDAMLQRPLELLDAGFPFVKKSLVGKFAVLNYREAVRERLAAAGHPTGV